MSKVEVISGDFEQGKWKLDENKLMRGKYIVRQIPVHDMTSLTKEEEVGGTIYVTAVFGTGQSLKAAMSRGAYRCLYESFSRHGNNPLNNELPLRKKSIKEFFFLAVGLGVAAVILADRNNGENKTVANDELASETIEGKTGTSVNTHTLSEKDKVSLCKAYIGELLIKSTSIINHKRTDDNGLIYVEYVREVDNSLWKQACEVNVDNIIWSAWLNDTKEWGRWRDEDRQTLYYNEQGSSIEFSTPRNEDNIKVPLSQ
jgi:hypothetical protein